MRRRPLNARQARSGLIWAAGLFVVGQLTLGAYLDYQRPLTRFPSARQIVDHAANEPASRPVVFVGSSRMGGAVFVDEMNGVMPRTDDRPWRALNAATPGGESISAEFVLSQLEQRGTIPEVLVIEVWPEAFNRKSPFMVQHAIRQFHWGDLPEYGDDIVRSNVGWLFLQARFVPGYTHRKQIIQELKQGANSPDRAATPRTASTTGPLDWTRIIRQANTAEPFTLDASQQAARTTIRKWLTPYQMEGPAIAALERIVIGARARRTEVVLVSMPTCSAHRAEYVEAVARPFQTLMDRLVAEHGCRYIDAQAWAPDGLFLDLLHLSPEGGKLFTHRFAQEVLIPVLTRGQAEVAVQR